MRNVLKRIAERLPHFSEKMRDLNMHPMQIARKGFTLVEMLVAMAVGSIVMVSIYTAYVNHQRSHVTQQLVVDMQQNARAALSLMKREIRMAGYDPWATDGVDNDGANGIDDEWETANAGFYAAGEGAKAYAVQFEADLNADGDDDDTNENVRYQIVNGTELERRSQNESGTHQTGIIAYDIEAIGFAYAFDNDGDGELDLSAGGNIIWAFDSNPGDDKLDQIVDDNDDGVVDENDTPGGVNMAGPQIDIEKIRAVRIWLLARTRQPIKGHADNRNYAVGAVQKGPATDGTSWDPRYRRLLLSTTVYCRNMGL